MLVLKRKKNQVIMLNNDIEIMITDIKGDSVKIGIKAPKHVSVHRKEIYELIHQQNIKSTMQNFDDLDKLSSLIKK